MPVPETTSAEAIVRHVSGKRTTIGKGAAWRDIQLTILVLPPVSELFGVNAECARMRDVSGCEDPSLLSLLQKLREELARPTAT